MVGILSRFLFGALHGLFSGLTNSLDSFQGGYIQSIGLQPESPEGLVRSLHFTRGSIGKLHQEITGIFVGNDLLDCQDETETAPKKLPWKRSGDPSMTTHALHMMPGHLHTRQQKKAWSRLAGR